eukprot:TRINITY_DN5263_c0_g2_i2.p1 TRINITY_DN5263_c0_g2~~TRINITY_DN5263_c0_g2_i2.p1  ORF type:complete len:141 (-),score=12.24 TRINITY_DN5263_c0_g2_i2:35-457(-)
MRCSGSEVSGSERLEVLLQWQRTRRVGGGRGERGCEPRDALLDVVADACKAATGESQWHGEELMEDGSACKKNTEESCRQCPSRCLRGSSGGGTVSASKRLEMPLFQGFLDVAADACAAATGGKRWRHGQWLKELEVLLI